MSWEEQGSEHTYRYRPLEGDPAVCALPPPLSTVLRRRLQHATALPGMRLLCLQTWKAPAERDRLEQAPPGMQPPRKLQVTSRKGVPTAHQTLRTPCDTRIRTQGVLPLRDRLRSLQRRGGGHLQRPPNQRNLLSPLPSAAVVLLSLPATDWLGHSNRPISVWPVAASRASP